MRQSPCSSTITGTPVRATSAAAASNGLCATIASGCERARLAAHAQRQRQPEQRPVERRAAAQAKRRVAAPSGRRRRDDAHVELVRERVPLAAQRLGERQPVPGPPDEEHAMLHAAAVSRIRSSSP